MYAPVCALACVVLTFLSFTMLSKPATAATNSTINFQARLLTAAGATVPDGDYNVEFKVYNALSSSGSSQGSCSGDANCLWVETRTSSNKVHVVNGYLTANLGSVTSFGSTINWDQELYLGMNIGGTGAASWDGEMSPRLKLTAVPYAFRAGKLAKLTSGNTSTLDFDTQTGARSILLPDASGTVCLQSATACGFAASSGSTNYIQNTTSQQSSSNFYISGNGKATTSLQAPLIDSISGALAIGTTNATAINLNQDTTIGSSKTLSVQGATSIQTGSTTALNVRASGGAYVLTADTTNSRVGIALGGTTLPSYPLDVAGNINSSTGYRVGGTAGSSVTCSGGQVLQNQVVSGGIVTGGSCTSSSGVSNLQGAYDGSTGGTTPEIKLDSTRGALDIQDADTTLGANLINVRGSNGSGLGTALFSVSSTGDVITQTTTDSTTALGVKTSLNNYTLRVDTANGRVGVNIGGGAPVLTAGGLEIKGGLRFSGAVSTYADTYITPLGTNIKSLINVVNYDPGGFSQLVALGLPSSASSTSRALTLLDARSGSHQPTLSVIDPTENEVGGLSWDGSSTAFLLKNSKSTGTIGLNINSVDALTASSSAVNLLQNTTLAAGKNMTFASGAGNFDQSGSSGTFASGTGTATLNGNVTVASTKTFTVTSGATSLTGATTGDALTVSNSSSTGNVAVFKDNSTAVATIADGGVATFKNSSDSTAGFIIQSTSANLFTVNTTNARIYIGPTAGDSVGTILVVGNKTNTTADPTGVDGAMYYNAVSKHMRCYYDGGWRNCNDASDAAYGYNLVEEFVGSADGADGVFGEIGWGKSNSGTASAVTGVAPDLYYRPGQIKLDSGTGTSGTNYANLFMDYLHGVSSGEPIIIGGGEEIGFAVNIPTLADTTNDYNLTLGLCDSPTCSGGSTNGVYFEYDRDQSVNWRMCLMNNGSANCTASSTAVSTGWHRYKIFVHTTSSIEYFVDGVSIGSNTSGAVPTGATEGGFSIIRDNPTGSADRYILVDYFQIRNALAGAR